MLWRRERTATERQLAGCIYYGSIRVPVAVQTRRGIRLAVRDDSPPRDEPTGRGFWNT